MAKTTVGGMPPSVPEANMRDCSPYDLLPDGALFSDAEGRVHYANERARELLGGDPVGEELSRLRPGPDATDADPSARLWRHLGGGLVELESSEAAVDEGRLILLRDGSAHAAVLHRLRERRERLARVVEAIPQVVLVLGPDADPVLANQAFERLTGRDVASLGHGVDGLLDAFALVDQAWVRSAVARALDGETLVGEVRFAPPAGSRRYELSLEPLGERVGAVLVARDVGPEQAMIELVQTAARKEVEQLSLLAGSMAHDLGNAFTVLASALGEGPSEPEAKARVERAIFTSRQITRDLRHLAQRPAGEGRSLIPLQELLAQVVTGLTEAAPRGVQVGLEEELGPLRVLATRGGLLRVLQQLGANAVRASQPTGRVMLKAWRDDGMAIIEVLDQGPGLPPEAVEQLFRPFSNPQADLGLARLRGLVRSFGGELELARTSREGSCFQVSLPLVEAAGPVAEAGAPALPGSVLLVEDDPEVLAALGALLEARGVQVRSASDGPGCLEALEAAEAPELVLMDFSLPGAGGDELLATLRERWPEVPVLVMSGYARAEHEHQVLELGAIGFLCKPFSVDELAALWGRRGSPPSA